MIGLCPGLVIFTTCLPPAVSVQPLASSSRFIGLWLCRARRFGGEKNPGAKKKAITAIAHTLLKIAYQVLKSGIPYTDLGADFYTRRESPEQKQSWLERQLQRLYPGCTVTITISPPEAALTPGV